MKNFSKNLLKSFYKKIILYYTTSVRQGSAIKLGSQKGPLAHIKIALQKIKFTPMFMR